MIIQVYTALRISSSEKSTKTLGELPASNILCRIYVVLNGLWVYKKVKLTHNFTV